ncbi:MAG: ABC transporter: Multidrug resistance-associated protein, ATP binding protein, partial [Streblomastix strix]
GDIERQSGEVKYDGQIAYCPQTPWINNNTVQGNITFGSVYDELKYNEVIHVCALEPDFQILPAGDMTAIGEKGVNLSGGQKARIQLARAVYSDRDIYILDDPLSAVDAHVGRFLFDECIDGRLKGKTRLLMTNQLQFLEKANNVILLKSGRIIAQGTYAELNAQGIDLSKYIIKNMKKKKEEVINIDEENKIINEIENQIIQEGDEQVLQQQSNEERKDLKDASAIQAGKQIHTEEEFETQSVPWSQYWAFFCTVIPSFGRPLYALLIVVLEIFQVGQNWWLGIIGSNTIIPQVSYGWKIGIYALAILILVLLLLIHAIVAAFGQKRSNWIIHNRLLDTIMKSPSSFFDTTPMGRILNRLTGDLTMVDLNLYTLFSGVLMMIMGFIGQVVIVAIDTPVFLAIGIPAMIVYYIINKFYLRASRNFQRMESISKSPIFSLYGETVTGAGLSTIRAFKLEDVWRLKFEKLVDQWAVRFVLFMQGNPWAALYASIASTVLMGSVVILGWFYMSAATLSIAIMAAFTFTFLGTTLIQQSTWTESQMTCFGRIQFYSTKLPQEVRRSQIKPIVPKKSWPKYGKVQFKNVSFRYRSKLPYVLNDVNFTFTGGEKIGVCGRTGAGKSSLLFPLFRLVELDPKLQPTMIDVNTGLPIEQDPNEEPNKGKILIDGKDISKIDLSRVRRSIAIIPQDPTLFTGTLRYNLDIANKCSDDRVWEVLSMVEMRDVISALPLGLDTQVAEGGSNFSAGQRQLICFGRAILNNCRIVVMDEATASVDVETDAKIQKTIREQFVDKTVIIIAHRLHTIMNSDRIMVMADGRVSELDTPANLLGSENSAFNKLVKSLDH